MIKYENYCCSCAVPAYPCMGNSCPNINVPVYYCDYCKPDVYAEYKIDNEHYCKSCAEEYIKGIFNHLTLSEQAELLEIPLESVED